MEQYNVGSSSNPMVVRRLNLLPATPFSGWGMLGRPVGWALAAMHKALFSADRIISMEVYEDHLFTYLAIFLTWQHIGHAVFHLFATTWKEKLTKKKHLLVSPPFLRAFAFSSVQDQHQIGNCSTEKLFTCMNILLDTFLFNSFWFGNRYGDRFLGWRTNLETRLCRLRLWVTGLWGRCKLNHEGMLVKNDKQQCA